MKKHVISIVVPVLNEEENVLRAYEAIVEELESRQDIEFEIIFTDNHSTDNTFDVLENLAAKDGRLKVLRFARNFGFNRSILAGYRQARGDAAIQIDCDLEDPPRMFHEFIECWKNGHDVVVGIRAKRQEGWLMAMMRRAFYVFLNRISSSFHEVDAGDFRLIDRKILDQLAVIDDAEPYVRGLISELASNQCGIEYTRDRRMFGKSKFRLPQLMTLALDAIYAHSTIPLRIATYTGIAVALVTTLLSAVYVIGRIVSPDAWPAGFATTTVLILFGISLNALFLGIIGEYIARIHQQVRHRPSIVIEKTLNLDTGDTVREEGKRSAL